MHNGGVVFNLAVNSFMFESAFFATTYPNGLTLLYEYDWKIAPSLQSFIDSDFDGDTMQYRIPQLVPLRIPNDEQPPMPLGQAKTAAGSIVTLVPCSSEEERGFVADNTSKWLENWTAQYGL
jgi:hypothetical protein